MAARIRKPRCTPGFLSSEKALRLSLCLSLLLSLDCKPMAAAPSRAQQLSAAREVNEAQKEAERANSKMVANIEALALKLPVLFSCRQAQAANLPQIQIENDDRLAVSGPLAALSQRLANLVGPNPYESEPRLAGFMPGHDKYQTPPPIETQTAYIKQAPAPRLHIRRAQGLNPLQPENAIEAGPHHTDQPGTIYIDIDWQGQFLIWGLALDRKALRQAGAYVYRFGQLPP